MDEAGDLLSSLSLTWFMSVLEPFEVSPPPLGYFSSVCSSFVASFFFFLLSYPGLDFLKVTLKIKWLPPDR